MHPLNACELGRQHPAEAFIKPSKESTELKFLRIIESDNNDISVSQRLFCGLKRNRRGFLGFIPRFLDLDKPKLSLLARTVVYIPGFGETKSCSHHVFSPRLKPLDIR